MNLRIAKKYYPLGLLRREQGHVDGCACRACCAWRRIRRRRKNHPTTKAWREWHKANCSEWDKIDDIERELGRGEDGPR